MIVAGALGYAIADVFLTVFGVSRMFQQNPVQQNVCAVAHVTLPNSHRTFDSWYVFVFCGRWSSCWKVCAHTTDVLALTRRRQSNTVKRARIWRCLNPGLTKRPDPPPPLLPGPSRTYILAIWGEIRSASVALPWQSVVVLGDPWWSWTVLENCLKPPGWSGVHGYSRMIRGWSWGPPWRSAAPP